MRLNASNGELRSLAHLFLEVEGYFPEQTKLGAINDCWVHVVVWQIA